MNYGAPTQGGNAGTWGTDLNNWLGQQISTTDGHLVRFTNEWSALDHGVVGDGVTDDTTNIKNFLSACDAAGAVAFFPARDYVSGAFYLNIAPRITDVSIHGNHVCNSLPMVTGAGAGSLNIDGVVTVTQSATPAIDQTATKVAVIAGLAQAITSMTSGLTGTPHDGQMLTIRITDNGTSRAITWGTAFESSTVSLPTTTSTPAMLTIGLQYNGVTSKWRCISVA